MIPRDLSIALTMAATVSKPVIYLPAPSDTPRITGAFISCAVRRIDLVHSRLLMLNCPTAYLPARALSNISLAETNIFLYLHCTISYDNIISHIIKNEKEYLYDIYVLIQRNMMYNHVCPKKISKERRPVWVI